MAWEVEYTDEFFAWWRTLNEAEQDSVAAAIVKLEQKGVTLDYPDSSDILSSDYKELRELRIQHRGRPYRVLYAFDPRRVAILLIGGSKASNKRWYKKYVPLANKIYEQYLLELEKEKENNDG
jgi:hypothetical protein